MNLTAEQQAIVNCNDPRIVVNSTAGAGKSRVLVARIQRLIAEGVDPSSIVAITYTVAAAKVLTERLVCSACNSTGKMESGVVDESCGVHEIVPCDYCHDAEIRLGFCGTLHGWLLRLLRQHHEAVGLPPDISVLDEEASESLLESVAHSLRVKASKTALREACQNIQPGTNVATTPTQIVASCYYRRCIQSGMLDFDMVLKLGLKLIESGCVKGVTNILWDELQDAGDADIDILEALAHFTESNLFCCLDFNQSIFGFRGAAPENLKAALANHNFTSLPMLGNFRCGEQICEAASNLIGHNEGAGVGTVCANERPAIVQIFPCDNEEIEIRCIAAAIRNIGGVSASDSCAVLLRTNALVDRFSKGLESYGIRVARQKVQETTPGWRRCLAFLRFAANPRNDYLARCWCLESDGETYAAATATAAAMRMVAIHEIIGFHEAPKLNDLLMVLAHRRIDPESIARVQQAIALLDPDASLAELLAALQEPPQNEEETGVAVITMHGAKGREFDHVFIPACDEGITPNLSKSSPIEEERRIFFVALTRARHSVTITHCATRVPQFGSRKPVAMQPSRFIAEMRDRKEL